MRRAISQSFPAPSAKVQERTLPDRLHQAEAPPPERGKLPALDEGDALLLGRKLAAKKKRKGVGTAASFGAQSLFQRSQLFLKSCKSHGVAPNPQQLKPSLQKVSILA